MTKTEILDYAEQGYKQLTELLIHIYNDKFPSKNDISLNDVLVSNDKYLQALLLKIAISDGNLSKEEAIFIRNITSYGTLFGIIDIVQLAGPDMKGIDVCSMLADTELCQLPLLFKLSQLVDMIYTSRESDRIYKLLTLLASCFCEFDNENISKKRAAYKILNNIKEIAIKNDIHVSMD